MLTCIYDYIFKEEVHKMHDINTLNCMLRENFLRDENEITNCVCIYVRERD